MEHLLSTWKIDCSTLYLQPYLVPATSYLSIPPPPLHLPPSLTLSLTPPIPLFTSLYLPTSISPSLLSFPE